MTILNEAMIEGLLNKYPEARKLIDKLKLGEEHDKNFELQALCFIIAKMTLKSPAEILGTFERVQHQIHKQLDAAQMRRNVERD